MNAVQPKKILSPSGQYVSPKIVERQIDGKLVTEAHWYDPVTMIIFHRGTVSVRDLEDASCSQAG